MCPGSYTSITVSANFRLAAEYARQSSYSSASGDLGESRRGRSTDRQPSSQNGFPLSGSRIRLWKTGRR